MKATLNKEIRKQTKKNKPLWLGPEDERPQGGITQSLLNDFLMCRERFRVEVIEGLQAEGGYSVSLGYGEMWHVCEEYHAAKKDWKDGLLTHCQKEVAANRKDQNIINHWFKVCKIQFPVYVDWWKKHPDVLKRVPLFQEKVFHIPYTLPSGRVVWLKGKFDSVDVIHKGPNKGVWLQENKTHSELKDERIERRLRFDLQTGLYLVALQSFLKGTETTLPPIRGVRYNCVRRPLGGGKGTIRQKQNETSEEFYGRLQEIIETDVENGEHGYFRRWNVEVSPEDVSRFKARLLHPILENLCDWYEWVTTGDPWRDGNKVHWQTPYGLYNIIVEGGYADVDNYIETGSKVGLHRVDSLFGEL